MIREERDPGFWLDVASHPDVAPALMGLAPRAVVAAVARPDVLPLASENGGYLFRRLDGPGLALELHSLFRPAGWGREAAQAGRLALCRVFETARLITTFEVEGNGRSRPPRSYGFTPAGDWRTTGQGRLRLWTLTQAGWESSPAYRRHTPCPSPSSAPESRRRDPSAAL